MREERVERRDAGEEERGGRSWREGCHSIIAQTPVLLLF
jgi:hypothetical protein